MYVLADILAEVLPLESVSEAIVAKFPQRAQTDENRDLHRPPRLGST